MHNDNLIMFEGELKDVFQINKIIDINKLTIDMKINTICLFAITDY